MIQEKLKDYFNVVFEKELINEIIEVGTYKKVKDNELLIDLGDKFDQIPLILSGAIKISHEDEKGEEIILYFLERGDTCTVTFGTGLNSAKSKIRGVAEKESEVGGKMGDLDSYEIEGGETKSEILQNLSEFQFSCVSIFGCR